MFDEYLCAAHAKNWLPCCPGLQELGSQLENQSKYVSETCGRLDTKVTDTTERMSNTMHDALAKLGEQVQASKVQLGDRCTVRLPSSCIAQADPALLIQALL